MAKHLAVIFADLHIHSYQQFNEDGNRLGNCLKALKEVFFFCKKNGIKTILFAGDLYDSHKSIPKEVVNETVATFVQLFGANPEIKMFAISGNHDQATKNLYGKPAVSALTHLHTIFPDNFIIMDGGVLEIGGGLLVAGVPYYEYAEHYTKRLQEVTEAVEGIKKTNSVVLGAEVKAYLMVHQTPNGIGNSMIPYEADSTDPIYDVYEHIFCGHIHSHQQLMPRFTVVGSPIHRDLADAGLTKGFLVMNLYKPEKGYIFQPLLGFPEFREIYEGDEIGEEDDNNFIVVKPRLDSIKLTETANVAQFNASLESAVLVTNYWQEVDGKDKELLKMGLTFVN